MKGVGLFFVGSLWSADDLQHGALWLRGLRWQRIIVRVLLSVRLWATDITQSTGGPRYLGLGCMDVYRYCKCSVFDWSKLCAYLYWRESRDLSGETIGICVAGIACSVSVSRLVGGLGLSGLVSVLVSVVASSGLGVALRFTAKNSKKLIKTCTDNAFMYKHLHALWACKSCR